MAAVNPNFNIDTVGVFTSLEADSVVDTNNHASGVALTVNASLTAITGRVYNTLQGAIDYFKGKEVSSCTITVASGTYVESIVIDEISCHHYSDLSIIGDYNGTTRLFAGVSFMHHNNFTWGNRTSLAGGGGVGGVTLLSQQTTVIANDTIRVTNSGGAVNFTTLGVAVGDTALIRSTAGAMTTHTVTQVSPGAVTTDLVVTPVVPAVAGNGSSLTILPNRGLVPGAAGVVMDVRVPCTIRGFYLQANGTAAATNHTVYIKDSSVLLDHCVMYNGYSGITSVNSTINPPESGGGVVVNTCVEIGVGSMLYQVGGYSNFRSAQFIGTVGEGASGIFADSGAYVSALAASVADSIVCFRANNASSILATGAYALAIEASGTRYGMYSYNNSVITANTAWTDTVVTGTAHAGMLAELGGTIIISGANIRNSTFGVSSTRKGALVGTLTAITFAACTNNYNWDESSTVDFVDGGTYGTVAAGTTVTHKAIGKLISTDIVIAIGTPLTIAIAAAANEANGVLAFTFPLGYLKIHGTEFHGTIFTSAFAGDTPEFGIGSTQAVGAVATLGAVAVTAENMMEGVATAALVVTPGNALDRSGKSATYADNLVDGTTTGAGAAATLYLNVADGWGGAQTLSLHGTVSVLWETAGDW